MRPWLFSMPNALIKLRRHASQHADVHHSIVGRSPRGQQLRYGLRILDQEEGDVVARQRFPVQGQRGRPPSVGEDR